MIVVDASVAMKWFVREADSTRALSLVTANQPMLAPWLMRLEVTNGLLRHYREEKLSEKAAREALSELDRLIGQGLIQLMPNEELWESAVGLAFKIKHTPADCLYLALGKATKATVVTADEALARRAANGGAKAMMLADYCKKFPVPG